MGRVIRGTKEDLVESKRLACLARNAQVTVGIETASEEAETKEARVSSAECRVLRFSIWRHDISALRFHHFALEYHHVVPVYNFLILLRAELLLDLARFEPFDPCQGIG